MQRTVLVIEDDEHTCAVYQMALSTRGYRVMMAAQGAEGVHLARTRRPDLVLLDIRMPVMDGWDALRYLRSYPETSHTPVCAISAFAPTRDELERFSDLDCFLVKPVDPREIVQMVEDRIGPPCGSRLPD